MKLADYIEPRDLVLAIDANQRDTLTGIDRAEVLPFLEIISIGLAKHMPPSVNLNDHVATAMTLLTWIERARRLKETREGVR